MVQGGHTTQRDLGFFFGFFFALLPSYALQLPIPPPLATYSCVSPPLLTFISFLFSSLDRTWEHDYEPRNAYISPCPRDVCRVHNRPR